jgi:hypothetical protein
MGQSDKVKVHSKVKWPVTVLSHVLPVVRHTVDGEICQRYGSRICFLKYGSARRAPCMAVNGAVLTNELYSYAGVLAGLKLYV